MPAMQDESQDEGLAMRGGGRWRPLAAALIGAAFACAGALYFAIIEDRAATLSARLWDASPYWLFVIMPAALLLTIWLRDRYFPGTDIPQTIASLKQPGAAWCSRATIGSADSFPVCFSSCWHSSPASSGSVSGSSQLLSGWHRRRWRQAPGV